MLSILAFFTIFATYVSKQYIYRQSEDNLVEVLKLVENYIYENSQEDFKTLGDDLNVLTNTSQIRVSIIDPDGVVVLDTDKDPSLLNNHSTRPEIYKAFNREENSIIRHSATLNIDLIYYAKMMNRPLYGLTHVIRVAMPYTELQLAYRSIYIYIGIWAILFLSLSVVLFIFLGNKLERPLNDLATTAQQYASLDFSTETFISSNLTEIQEVFSSMRHMAKKIVEQIDDIQQQKEELQVVLDGMTEAVIVLDPHGQIIESNPSAEQAFSVKGSSLIGKYYLQLLRNSELNEIVEDALDTIGQPIQQSEIKVQLNDHFYQVHLSRIGIETELESKNILMVLNDITTLMHLEKVRRDFVANVSHELKTPVTSIKGFTETLLYSDLSLDPQKSKHFLKIINSQTDRLHAIIEDLLTLSRLEQSHNRADDFIPINLNSVISDSVQICRDKPGNEERTITIECNRDLQMRGNSLLLEQTLINLIDNALKYSEVTTPVKVICSKLPTQVRIEVSDKGYGIPHSSIDRIFERFYRVDKGRSRDKGGTGLGLAIVKHIVAQHQGTIEVKSEEGEGTTFSLTFPTGEGS